MIPLLTVNNLHKSFRVSASRPGAPKQLLKAVDGVSFELKAGENKTFKTLLNATYLGKYYLPAVSVEAMYNASQHARVKGQWVEVTKPGTSN